MAGLFSDQTDDKKRSCVLRRKLADELEVAVEKIVLHEIRRPLPQHPLEFRIHRNADEIGHAIELQMDHGAIAVSDRLVMHQVADGRVDAELLAKFPSQRLLGRFARLDLAARKFPLHRVAPVFPLADKHSAIAFDHRGYDFHSAIIEARMHSERLLEHFQHPRNAGELAPPAVKVDVSNPACGDMLRLWVRFENDHVAEARFQTRGCTASIAASSALTEWMVGKTREELKSLTAATIEEAVGGLEPASKHAAVLCVDGVKRLLLQ